MILYKSEYYTFIIHSNKQFQLSWFSFSYTSHHLLTNLTFWSFEGLKQRITMESLLNNLEKHDLNILKKLHLLMFQKSVGANFVRRGIRAFRGFHADHFNSNLEFIQKEFVENDIIDICGVLEISATLNIQDNIKGIIKTLTLPISEDIIDTDTEDLPEIEASHHSTSSHRSTEPFEHHSTEEESAEMRTAIRSQSKEIFVVQQKILDIEEDMEVNRSEENLRQLTSMRRKLLLFESRKRQMEEEYLMFFNGQQTSRSSNLLNPVVSISQEMTSFKHEVKSMLSKNQQNMQLPDFDGASSIEWHYFKIQFDTTTKNFKLSDEENIIRLNLHLKGNARQKVELILKSCKDPRNIMKILNIEYGGQDNILKEILQRVHDIKRVNSFADFKIYNCSLQNISSVLTEMDNGLFDVQKIIAILIGKIPEHLMSQWANYLLTNKLSQKSITLKVYAEWINDMSGILSDVHFFNLVHTTDYVNTKELDTSTKI